MNFRFNARRFDGPKEASIPISVFVSEDYLGRKTLIRPNSIPKTPDTKKFVVEAS
jgi:hypothetical protein